MNPPVWQLDLANYQASLQIDQLSTQVTLDQPSAGWQALRCGDESLHFAPAQIWLGSHAEQIAHPPTGMHVRGTDVVATYASTEDRPFTTQIYRCVERKQCGQMPLLVMSTLVSLHTHLLDAQLQFTLRTDRPAQSELLRGTEAGFHIADQTSPDEGSPTALLLRPDDSQLSYVELWHAIDYAHFEQATDHWQHSFSEPLEKGVIRRLLLWSALVPRADDLVLAAALQQQFSETAPPLTT
jgi:hypothetical protein